MRWIKKYVGIGSTRVVKRFAWFPVTIGAETRWLEMVYLGQRYSYFPDGLVSRRWVTEYFVERDKYEAFINNAKD